ncbi:hypothetical protein CLOM_g2632, partial [Closterium sp. NIES-68]
LDHVCFWWGEKQQAAFDQWKIAITSPPVLRIADPDNPYEVITDASDIAIGTILLQDFGEGLQPVTYESRKLQGAQKKYTVHDKEMLAIVHAFKTWQCYLTSADVTVRTDQKSLQYLRAQPNLNPRQIRWLDFLEKLQLNKLPNCSSRTSSACMDCPPPLFQTETRNSHRISGAICETSSLPNYSFPRPTTHRLTGRSNESTKLWSSSFGLTALTYRHWRNLFRCWNSRIITRLPQQPITPHFSSITDRTQC